MDIMIQVLSNGHIGGWMRWLCGHAFSTGEKQPASGSSRMVADVASPRPSHGGERRRPHERGR